MHDITTLRERIAAMARDARRAAEDDAVYWEEQGTGQDTEEAEESGAIIARADTLTEVLALIDEAQ